MDPMLSVGYELLSPSAQAHLMAVLSINKPEFNTPAIPEFNTLREALDRSRLDQVDVTLMLLRAGFTSDVEALTGCPVKHCPTRSALRNSDTSLDRSDWLDDWLRRHPDRWDIDNWRVKHVAQPCRATAEQAAVHRLIRTGYTVRQLVMRGISYEYIDLAQSRRWIGLAPCDG